MKEAHILINGVILTEAQSMTVRVAIENFAADLKGGSLGEDQHGVAMTTAYTDRISEIRSALYK